MRMYQGMPGPRGDPYHMRPKARPAGSRSHDRSRSHSRHHSRDRSSGRHRTHGSRHHGRKSKSRSRSHHSRYQTSAHTSRRQSGFTQKPYEKERRTREGEGEKRAEHSTDLRIDDERHSNNPLDKKREVDAETIGI